MNNFIKRYLVLGDEKLAIHELHPHGADASTSLSDPSLRSGGDTPGGLKSLSRTAKDGAEAEAIARALEETNWNRKQAAAMLQISYKALLYKIRQYGIAEVGAHHKLSAGA